VLKTIFKSERELLGATAESVDPAHFEIPDGFKQK